MSTSTCQRCGGFLRRFREQAPGSLPQCPRCDAPHEEDPTIYLFENAVLSALEATVKKAMPEGWELRDVEDYDALADATRLVCRRFACQIMTGTSEQDLADLARRVDDT